MMELFLSKVWMFIVGMVLMAVLLQGVQLSADMERSSALDEVAEELRVLFQGMEGAGPGLEMTLSMDEMLPSSVTLTIHMDHAVISDGGDEVVIGTPRVMLRSETTSPGAEESDHLFVRTDDSLLLTTDEEGMTITLLSPRTCPPRT